MKYRLIIAAGFLYAACALAQPPQNPSDPKDTKSPSMGEKTGTNSLLGITPSTEEFVKDVALSDMFEISSSKLAAERGDAHTKTFANQMLKDHQKTTAELTGLIKSGKVEISPPDKLDDQHQREMEKLQNLKGADFSKRYGQDQVDAHTTAVSLFERYSKSGDNPALKDWAAKTLPALQGHLQMAQSLPQ